MTDFFVGFKNHIGQVEAILGDGPKGEWLNTTEVEIREELADHLSDFVATSGEFAYFLESLDSVLIEEIAG